MYSLNLRRLLSRVRMESGYWNHHNLEDPPVAIVSASEYTFSEDIGILGDIAAGKEQMFGTLAARLMSWMGG